MIIKYKFIDRNEYVKRALNLYTQCFERRTILRFPLTYTSHSFASPLTWPFRNNNGFDVN
ncbi:hypothetical protein [Mucilaginibacter sp.]|uniref:hypothetical protein n=1 Tax=Mucilaginibacter sp. TaxID=1882438 RepID=UPI00262691AB|nr:hypothetical protein [Mucilaginibacter sp.]